MKVKTNERIILIINQLLFRRDKIIRVKECAPCVHICFGFIIVFISKGKIGSVCVTQFDWKRTPRSYVKPPNELTYEQSEDEKHYQHILFHQIHFLSLPYQSIHIPSFEKVTQQLAYSQFIKLLKFFDKPFDHLRPGD